MTPQDLRIHGGAECRKAIGHLEAALEYYGWLNYHGSAKSDQEYEESLRALIEDFMVLLKDRIG